MHGTLKELFVKPMITGIAAGIFPTLLVLYGVQQTMGELRVREQLVSKASEDHAALLQEKVKLIADKDALQEKYELLIEQNTRLTTRIQSMTESVVHNQDGAAPEPAS